MKVFNLKPVIYLDLDGVCSDFTSAAIVVNGKDPKQVFDVWENKFKSEFLPYVVMDIDKDDYWQSIHNASEDFWINIKEYSWFFDMYQSLKKITDVVFLSSTTYDGSCLSGKLKWLQKRFGREFQEYIFTSNKHRLANKYSILIDDYHSNVSKFIEYGGSAVLFPQIWNENHTVKDKMSFTLENVSCWYENLKSTSSNLAFDF